MSANLENSVLATGLEKISFHSNPNERQCQRMFKLLFGDTHVEQRPRSATPGYWNIGGKASYMAFWNPWPLSKEELADAEKYWY